MDNQNAQIVPQQESVTISSKPPFRKKKIVFFISLFLILMVAVLFAPVPYYQSQNVECKIGQVNCPTKGWHLGLSLWQKLQNNTSSSITEEQRVLNGELLVRGTVEYMDVTNMSVDGDGVAKIKDYKGKVVTINVPAGERPCKADIDNFLNLTVGDEVEVFGIFSNDQTLLCESPQHYIRIVKKSDTSDWQIYRSEEYGFEVKYPQGWLVSVATAPDASNKPYGHYVNFFDPLIKVYISIIRSEGEVSYCEASLTSVAPPLQNQTETRCEALKGFSPLVVIDWEADITKRRATATLKDLDIAFVDQPSKPINNQTKEFFRTFLSTFRFID